MGRGLDDPSAPKRGWRATLLLDVDGDRFVKGLVEGGRGAQHGKIEAGHLLISVNGQDVTKYKLAQVLMKIKDSDRPVTLEFETVPKSNAGATIGDFHGNVYNTLFEQGPIGISFHEETRDEGGGAVSSIEACPFALLEVARTTQKGKHIKCKGKCK